MIPLVHAFEFHHTKEKKRLSNNKQQQPPYRLNVSVSRFICTHLLTLHSNLVQLLDFVQKRKLKGIMHV